MVENSGKEKKCERFFRIFAFSHFPPHDVAHAGSAGDWRGGATEKDRHKEKETGTRRERDGKDKKEGIRELESI